MRFGTYYFLQAPPGRTAAEIVREEIDQMVLSEELGYDSVWLTEHHYADYGLLSAPEVVLATVAARTRRVQLGMAVWVLPFHNPLRLAEVTAMLDIVSGGRLTVGLGRGNRPLEFVGHQVPQEQSRERMEEGLEALLQAWTCDRVAFQGRYWRFPGIPVRPQPLTQPHPPLAFAVTSRESLAWAGARGLAILSSGLTTPLDRLLENRRIYVEALEAAGHPPEAVRGLLSRWAVSKHVYVAPSDAEARADAEGPERWYLDAFARSLGTEGLEGLHPSVYAAAQERAATQRRHRWEDLVENALLIGSPDTVAEKVAELQRAGVGELLCWQNFGGLPPEKARRSMRLFAEHVLPRFKPA